MKRVILTVSALMAALVSANAQDAPVVATDYKPNAGDVVVELGLTGGILNTNSTLNPGAVGAPTTNPLLKVRYFLGQDLAVRVGFALNSNSTTNKAYQVDNNGAQTSTFGTEKLKSSYFGLNLGLEKHFAGTERLSTYIGGDLLLGFAGASQTNENFLNNAYDADYKLSVKGTNGTANSGFGFGLRAVTGADYYFVKKVYLGAELGFGFTTFKNGKVKTEETRRVLNSVTTTTTETKSDGGSFQLAPSVVAGVRIGYIF